MLFHMFNMLCAFTLLRTEVCVRCPIWLSFVVPWFRCFPACYWGIDWVIIRCLLLLLFLRVSILLSHSTLRWISIMRSYTLYYYCYHYRNNNNNNNHYTAMTLTKRLQRWKCETRVDALPDRKIVMMMMYGVYEIWYFKAVIVKICFFLGGGMWRHVFCRISTDVLEEPPAFVLSSTSKMKTSRFPATLASYKPPDYTITLSKTPQFKYF